MRTRFVLFAAFMLVTSHVLAQTAPAPPRPAQPAVPPPPPPPAPAPTGPQLGGQPINVRVELNISEEGGGIPPVKKTVSAVVADGFNGSVRESGFSAGRGPGGAGGQYVPLNLDAHPTILTNGKIRLTCVVQYNAGAPAPTADRDPRPGTDIKQNLVSILESGKSLVVSQATDPITDRRVTVEVTATILR